jgi:hypothetical protein
MRALSSERLVGLLNLLRDGADIRRGNVPCPKRGQLCEDMSIMSAKGQARRPEWDSDAPERQPSVKACCGVVSALQIG